MYSSSGDTRTSPSTAAGSRQPAAVAPVDRTPRGTLAVQGVGAHPGTVLQSSLSPAPPAIASAAAAKLPLRAQGPVFKSGGLAGRAGFALPQPQQYANYLPSPHSNINVGGAGYSYHDSAQKAAVDNYYHRTFDDLQLRKYPKLAAEQQIWTAQGFPVVQPVPVVMQTIPSIGTPVSGSGSNPTSGAERKNRAGGTQEPPAATYPLRKNTQETMAKSIAERYRDRPISEYATIVRQAEIAVLNMDSQNHSKTAIQTAEQNRERERQVYALLWLMKNCVSENDSYVPRGRIFAQYAASCAQNSLKPLSQASLGKLIRSVFPHLTTRRLGMRGQSRYHYCGLRLINDDAPGDVQNAAGSSHGSAGHSSSSSQQKPLPRGSTPMASSGSISYEGDSSAGKIVTSDTQSASKSPSPEFLKLEPSPISLGQYSNDYDMIFVEDFYKKVFDNEIPIPAGYSLKFPSIPIDRLPAGIDRDIVSSLESLYHVHCNTIFEHVRFMKFDQLENVLMVFGQGSISPQMYNLFTSKELYDWIHECDVITHVSLIKCLSRMIMGYEDVSYETLTKLELFFRDYVSLTTKATMDLPVPMVQKKKEVVENFSRLVRKLVKFLKFLKQIRKSLLNFRDMKDDWESYVKLDDVLYIVKRDGYEEITMIIKTFMTVNVMDLVEELAAGNVRLDLFVKKYIELISSLRTVPAFKIMDGVTAFSRAFMADISLTLQQRGLPWYFLDMLSSLLVSYCFELNRFIS